MMSTQIFVETKGTNLGHQNQTTRFIWQSPRLPKKNPLLRQQLHNKWRQFFSPTGFHPGSTKGQSPVVTLPIRFASFFGFLLELFTAKCAYYGQRRDGAAPKHGLTPTAMQTPGPTDFSTISCNRLGCCRRGSKIREKDGTNEKCLRVMNWLDGVCECPGRRYESDNCKTQKLFHGRSGEAQRW